MEFKLEQALEILERTPTVIALFLKNIDSNWVNSNEGNDSWSPYDIVGHYIHGEKTDWIPRMNIILHDDDKHFIPFDRFAQFNDSEGKTISELLDEFKKLREKNIQSLKAAALTENHLSQKGIHPQFGEVSLRELLAAWVVHDLAHINQVARVMAKQYKEAIGPWKAYMNIVNR